MSVEQVWAKYIMCQCNNGVLSVSWWQKFKPGILLHVPCLVMLVITILSYVFVNIWMSLTGLSFVLMIDVFFFYLLK